MHIHPEPDHNAPPPQLRHEPQMLWRPEPVEVIWAFDELSRHLSAKPSSLARPARLSSRSRLSPHLPDSGVSR
jgi:hypothetical protein